jgi:4-hydroxybenzoate polyprenyltransferase/phosphoglycolate phosphatase-like HAD superfamily hydrolase
MTKNIIAVDLDGTLVQSDLLVESFFLFLRQHPLQIFRVVFWLLNGKAYFKRRLADAVLPEAARLPYNQPLLAWLHERKKAGVRLVLATASDQRIAERVAAHLGLFDEVLGTGHVQDGKNLASGHKRDALVERYGARGYEYVGNSAADLKVWAGASRIHVANPERGVLERARKLAQQNQVEMGQVFDERPPYGKSLRRALRLHQWAKNTLIFVPLVAAHRVMELPLLGAAVLAFIAFGLCASSVYLLNDLLDLPDDRRHTTKRHRPLAAGALPVLHGVLFVPVLLTGAFALALYALPIGFVLVLIAYYLLTLAYSLWLKRMVMVDVIALALLYTVRIMAGTQAVALRPTFWMLAFSMFIFLSLAFVKRYTELRDARQQGKTEKAAGRGYLPADFELLASLGGASGYLSVLVLSLYINDTASATLYSSPQWMWAACPLLLFWLSRVWLMAHRGEMHDDPVVFALRDGVSRWVAGAFVLVFVLATLA